MKIHFNIIFICYILAVCDVFSMPAIIENNQSAYFGQSEKYFFIEIKDASSVEKIAEEYHVPIQEIKRLNSLSCYHVIQEGVIVKIPINTYYIIKHNDTIQDIARVHDIDLNILAGKNGLLVNSDIYAGDYIIIPESTKHFVETNDYKNINFYSADITNKKTTGNNEYAQKSNKNQKLQSSMVRNDKIKKVGGTFKNPRPMNSRDFIWPIDGYVIKRYGYYGGKLHEGISISAEKGESVKASSRGEVVYSGKHLLYGNLLILKHNNGYMTAYSNLDSFLVKKGQIVNKGTQIAIVGDSLNLGRIQLQFSVQKDNHTINPDQ